MSVCRLLGFFPDQQTYDDVNSREIITAKSDGPPTDQAFEQVNMKSVPQSNRRLQWMPSHLH
jgi:hypothetical protein